MSPAYILLCTVVGVAIGWLPRLLHGPIPWKFDVHYIRGEIAVWNWYLARSLIGFFVGITIWPRRWWVRGPLIGFLMLLPPGMVTYANPECGMSCSFWNEVTGTTIGLVVAGVAYWVTRRHHAADHPPAR